MFHKNVVYHIVVTLLVYAYGVFSFVVVLHGVHVWVVSFAPESSIHVFIHLNSNAIFYGLRQNIMVKLAELIVLSALVYDATSPKDVLSAFYLLPTMLAFAIAFVDVLELVL